MGRSICTHGSELVGGQLGAVGRRLAGAWRGAMGGRRRMVRQACGSAPTGHDTRRPRHRGRYRELTIAHRSAGWVGKEVVGGGWGRLGAVGRRWTAPSSTRGPGRAHIMMRRLRVRAAGGRASSVIGRCLHMRTGGVESVGRWLVCGWRVAMGGRRRAMGRAYGWAPSGHDTRRPRHRGRYRELTIAAPFGGVGREGGAVGCRFGDSRWLPSASGHSSSSPVFASDVVPLSLSLAPVRFLGCLEGPLEREGSIREQSAIEQSNPNI